MSRLALVRADQFEAFARDCPLLLKHPKHPLPFPVNHICHLASLLRLDFPFPYIASPTGRPLSHPAAVRHPTVIANIHLLVTMASTLNGTSSSSKAPEVEPSTGGFQAQNKMAVQPPTEDDLQRSYATVVRTDVDYKGWYGSMSM